MYSIFGHCGEVVLVQKYSFAAQVLSLFSIKLMQTNRVNIHMQLKLNYDQDSFSYSEALIYINSLECWSLQLVITTLWQ